MFRATVKNSFITLEDLEANAARGSSLRRRAMSSGSILEQCRPDESRCCDDYVQLQLHRLDSLLRNDLMKEKTMPESRNAQVGTLDKLPFADSKWCRVSSNSSVSTMDSENTSDCGNDVPSALGSSRGHRRVVSNTSACSQISEDSEENSMENKVQVQSKPQSIRAPGDDFSHGKVPKHVNLAEEFAATSSSTSNWPTTIMIRNIPNRLSQQQIMKELERVGFAGTFDFFYAPTDKRTKCTVGYAFVNFVNPEMASMCMRVFERHCFPIYGRQGQKQAKVSVAHLQGLEANIRHYRNSAVSSNLSEHQSGPIIMPHLSKGHAAF